MLRGSFDRQLHGLQADLLTLGDMVEQAILDSVDALKACDRQLAQRVITGDAAINHKRFEMEENCLDLIATQAPMARDLRTIIAVLILSNELERMGDYAVGIARINVMMADQAPVKPLIDIPAMAEKATDMMRRALEAFIRANAESARAIAREDDQVDALNHKVYLELLGLMLSDPSTIQRATWLLWVAHNLERIADRVTNICERVVFMTTGQLQEMDGIEQKLGG